MCMINTRYLSWVGIVNIDLLPVRENVPVLSLLAGLWLQRVSLSHCLTE